MTKSPLAPIVLGHNAFFGVDHLSAARGAERAAFFADPQNILDMIHTAYDHGVRGMMMSTHDRAGPVAELIRNDPKLSQDMAIYPLLPYAQKYITKANEMGLINVVIDALSGSGLKSKVSFLWQGGKGVLTKDVTGMLSALIRLELNIFRGLNMPAVFLHDALTDLALGLELKDIFSFFIEELDKNHNSQGSFATKNLPLLQQRFKEWGLPTPTVLTHANKIGFHMNPSLPACEDALNEGVSNVMAMGTLASGYLSPDEAYSYLGQFPTIKSVVVGVSSSKHADETFAAIKTNGWDNT